MQDTPEHSHDSAAIRRRLEAGPTASYLRDWVYGGIDGAVTTFAIVAGAAGAGLPPRVVLVLGVANLVGDGFSMAAGNFSGTRAERDEYARLRAVEERHVAQAPDGEREEVRQIYRAKGFRDRDLERAVAVITADRERWIDTMMAEEYGQPKVLRLPWKAALSTFAAFFLCGSIPLLPFLTAVDRAPAASLVATALVFFGIGSARSRWSTANWWRAGLGTLAVGLAAATLAFLVGRWVEGLA